MDIFLETVLCASESIKQFCFVIKKLRRSLFSSNECDKWCNSSWKIQFQVWLNLIFQVAAIHLFALFDMHNIMSNHAFTLVFWDTLSFSQNCFFKLMCSSEYPATKLSPEIALKMEVQGVQVRVLALYRQPVRQLIFLSWKWSLIHCKDFRETGEEEGLGVHAVSLEHCSCILRAGILSWSQPKTILSIRM